MDPVGSPRDAGDSQPLLCKSSSEIYTPESTSSVQRAGDEVELDIVQYSAGIYFVEEREGYLEAEIMRMGSLEGTVSVRWTTQDSSAKAGLQYEHSEGEVIFEPGQNSVTVAVKILKTVWWNPILEFVLDLENPQNCELGLYLKQARVKVKDAQAFPSDNFEEYLTRGADGVEEIPNHRLFGSFVDLLFRQEGMLWRTLLTLVMDQGKNANVFLQITLNIYLVDTVFNTHDKESEKELFFFDSREREALAVACLILGPMVVIHMWDHVRIMIDTQGHVREYLQQGLFRKYLNYNSESREKVSAAAMFTHVLRDTAEVAELYAIVLNLIRLLGKVTVLTIFTYQQSPQFIGYILLMPTLMFLWSLVRASTVKRYSRASTQQKEDFADYITEICSKYGLVADYAQRPHVNAIFGKKCSDLREAEIPWAIVVNNTEYVTKWLGPCFTAVYLARQASQVLAGEISLGTFLATINIFAQVSGDFSEVFQLVMKVNAMLPALKDLTLCFNLQTDFDNWKAVNRTRRATTKKLRADAPCIGGSFDGQTFVPSEDTFPLQLNNISFRYGEKFPLIIKDVSLSCEQGKIVAVLGSQGSGRNTLMQLLAHKIFPTSGSISFPSHLRILHVAHDPVLLREGLWVNLTFGRGKNADPKRVISIAQKMDLPPQLLTKLKQEAAQHREETNEKNEEDLDEQEEKDDTFTDVLSVCSSTVKAKIHLARAFIMNPEICVMQRPFAHMDQSRHGQIIWKLLNEHVRNRGLGLPSRLVHRRRPRTVFFVTASEETARQCDVMWHLDEEELSIHEEILYPAHKQRTPTVGHAYAKRKEPLIPL